MKETIKSESEATLSISGIDTGVKVVSELKSIDRVWRAHFIYSGLKSDDWWGNQLVKNDHFSTTKNFNFIWTYRDTHEDMMVSGGYMIGDNPWFFK